MLEINFADVVMRLDIELRKKNLNRTALAGCGVNPTGISHWKNGRVPSCSTIANIADFLGLSMEYLLTGKERAGELTQEELSLLDNYRALSVQSRAVVMTVVKGLRQ